MACISCGSCQQTRPISSSRIHRISTKLSMHHNIYLLSSLIISFYILTTLLLCYMFSKGHVTLTQHFFRSLHSVCLSNLRNFFAKKTLEFLFQGKKHFRDEMTRLVINTRLFTTLKSVAMLKIIKFCWFMNSTFCGWMCSEKFLYVFFGRWFCWCVIFKHGRGYKMLWTVSIYFLLFYHHCVMLKTDNVLDCW